MPRKRKAPVAAVEQERRNAGASKKPKRSAASKTANPNQHVFYDADWSSVGEESSKGLPPVIQLTGPGIKGSSKVAGFDLDYTLIKPKSGKKWPTGPSDWMFLNDKVEKKLKELHKDGYKIVIISNQGGIEKGHTKPTDFQLKINQIANALQLPIQMAENKCSYSSRPFECRICRAEFKEKSKLFDHLEEVHQLYQRGYNCRKCNYSTTRAGNLRRHCDNVHEKRRRSRSRSRSPRRQVRRIDPLQSTRVRPAKGARTPPRATVEVVQQLPSRQPQSPAAISLSCSPNPTFSISPPRTTLKGKPLAMLMQSLSNSPSSDSEESSTTEEPPAQNSPQPVAQQKIEAQQEPISPLELPDGVVRIPEDGPIVIPPGKILGSMVQRMTRDFYAKGVLAHQTHQTGAFTVLFPAEWNNN